MFRTVVFIKVCYNRSLSNWLKFYCFFFQKYLSNTVIMKLLYLKLETKITGFGYFPGWQCKSQKIIVFITLYGLIVIITKYFIFTSLTWLPSWDLFRFPYQMQVFMSVSLASGCPPSLHLSSILLVFVVFVRSKIS